MLKLTFVIRAIIARQAEITYLQNYYTKKIVKCHWIGFLYSSWIFAVETIFYYRANEMESIKNQV